MQNWHVRTIFARRGHNREIGMRVRADELKPTVLDALAFSRAFSRCSRTALNLSQGAATANFAERAEGDADTISSSISSSGSISSSISS